MNSRNYKLAPEVYACLETQRNNIKKNLNIKGKPLSQSKFSKLWILPRIKNIQTNVKMNRKGSIFDLTFMIVALLGLAIFVIVAGYVYLNVTGQMKLTELGADSNSLQALNAVERLVAQYDYIFIVIFVGLTIGIFITSYNIYTSPIILPIYILLLAILVIISAVAQHVYQTLADIPEFIARDVANPMMSYLMNHLIIASIGVGVLSMVLMFAKPKSQYGGAY